MTHPYLDIDTPVTIPWMFSGADAATVAGRTVEVKLSRELINRMKSPVKISISEWAQAHRIVMPIDSSPGPWRQEKVPHTARIMDTIGKPWVREVWMCMVERSGKTQVLLNSAMWSIDQGMKSGNIFWLMPTEMDARTALGERIIPALRASRATARHMSARADDTSRGMIRFNHGMRLKPAWSNSPSSLASYFGRFNIADETDKYAERTSEGTDPITLFLKRSRDDKRGSKYVFASTPGGRYIYKGMRSCQQVWEYRVKCPDCGEQILMDGGHFIIPDGITADTIHHAEIQYACNACGGLWTENTRDNAYHAGRWFCIKGADLSRPETVGFHFPAFPCPMVPFAEIAAAYIKAKIGGIAEKTAWANGYEAIDYIEEIGEAPELAALADRAESYAPIIPMGAGVLTAGVDVQGDRLEIEVVAWGIGAESWGVEYAVLWGDPMLPDVWNQLDGFLLRTWTHATGQDLRISRCFVDSGYLPNQVAKFCAPRRARGVYAIKGASADKAPELQGPNKQKHGSVSCMVYNLGTNRLKTQMFAYFGINAPGAGYCHLPDTYPAKWYEMLQAERVIEKPVGATTVNVWVKKSSGIRNESIDLRVYALAAFMSMKINMKTTLAGLNQLANNKRRESTPAGSHTTRPLPTWFNNRK